ALLVRSLLNDGGPNGALVNIATISRTANVVTVVTAAAHGLVVGDQVVIAGVTGGATSFNNAAGTSFTVVSATPASNTFTYAQTGGNESGNPNTDRKSTRLNSSHGSISYAVFCLKKKKKKKK